ncbi:hypothetical protein GCM10023082_10350 [Streptomyces tremellae]|uniref:Uncharacterized protein n=1 Tax=Streptomyces tremellae TaxID=1124239 RepID=A0ABP7E5J4_9ACTN
MDELPGERFAALEIAVRPGPHAAHRDPVARRDGLPDPGEDLRVLLLDPRVLLGGRAGEEEFGVLTGEGRHVGEGAGALADGLAHGPQPGGVDVGVADRGDGVRGGVGGPGQHAGEPVAGGGRAARDVGGDAGGCGAAQGVQDPLAARGAFGKPAHQLVEHFDVVDQVPGVLVAHGDLGLPQPVEAGGARSPWRAVVGADAGAADDGRVRGEFHEEAHGLAACGVRGERRAAAVKVQALERGP